MDSAKFPDGTERRAACEMRAAGRKLEGYASVFNVETRIGGFYEVVRPGAFRASLLDGHDILALMDHDANRLLGRTKAGTLRLSEDARGLHFDVDVADTTLGRDALAMAARGDLGGASFLFRSVDEAWPTRDRRELRAVTLLEISIVTAFPAYSETEVHARSMLHATDDMRAALRFRRMLAGVL